MGAVSAGIERVAAAWLHWMIAVSWQVALLLMIVWLATRTLRRQSASLRCALWLLVFLRLILPPTFASPWSMTSLGSRMFSGPHVPVREGADAGKATQSPLVNTGRIGEQLPGVRFLAAATTGGQFHPAPLIMAVWAVGFVVLFGLMVVQSRRYARRIMRDCAPVTGRAAATADALCEQLGVTRRPAVLVSPHIRIPAVFGFGRATILLPQSLVDELPEARLSNLIGHELAHVRRRDIPAQWLVSLLVCVYWFHPAVWLANLYMRREREMACDDAVLYATRQEGREYSATIVRVAELFAEHVPAGAGFLGMLEVSDNLLLRVRSILDGTRPRRSGWAAALLLMFFLVVIMPMGTWAPPAKAEPAAQPAAQQPNKPDQAAPQLVSSTPANGAKDVAPALDRIVLKFNLDMEKGCSWTGGPPYFPETTGQSEWVDSRTCALPVRLEKGKYYRFGVNSKSYQNFRSVSGVPVKPMVIAFVTQGADPSLVAALDPPNVVSLTPPNDAADVGPKLDGIKVAFDKPMGGGFSWVGGGDSYPETSGKPEWSEDEKTCSLPVKLKPGWTYTLGLNSASHNNFQSAYGVPLEPVVWHFSTADKK